MGATHTTELVTVTPAIAADWLAHDVFKDQRTVRESHVAYLCECIKNGELDTGEPIRFVKVKGGNKHLVNGQHRLHAVVLTNKPVTFLMVTTTVDSDEELAEIYGRIDRGKTRSILDAFKGYGERSDLPISFSQATFTASAGMFVDSRFMVRQAGSVYSSRSADYRRSVAVRYAAAASAYFSVIIGHDRRTYKMLCRRAVLSVGLVVYMGTERAKQKADDFWRGVASDDGLYKEDPRKQLLHFLQKNPAFGAHGNDNYVARGVAGCWNAWFQNRSLTVVKPTDPTEPINILGTTFSARTQRRYIELSEPLVVELDGPLM